MGNNCYYSLSIKLSKKRDADLWEYINKAASRERMTKSAFVRKVLFEKMDGEHSSIKNTKTPTKKYNNQKTDIVESAKKSSSNEDAKKLLLQGFQGI